MTGQHENPFALSQRVGKIQMPLYPEMPLQFLERQAHGPADFEQHPNQVPKYGQGNPSILCRGVPLSKGPFQIIQSDGAVSLIQVKQDPTQTICYFPGCLWGNTPQTPEQPLEYPIAQAFSNM